MVLGFFVVGVQDWAVAQSFPVAPGQYFLGAIDCKGSHLTKCPESIFPDLEDRAAQVDRCSAIAINKSNEIFGGNRGEGSVGSLIKERIKNGFATASLDYAKYKRAELFKRRLARALKNEDKVSKTFNELYDAKFADAYAVLKRQYAAFSWREAACERTVREMAAIVYLANLMAEDFYSLSDDFKSASMKVFVPTAAALEKQGRDLTFADVEVLSEQQVVLFIRNTLVMGWQIDLMRQAHMAQLVGCRVTFAFGDTSQFPKKVGNANAFALVKGQSGEKLMFNSDPLDKENKVARTLCAIDKQMNGARPAPKPIELSKPSVWKFW